MKFSSVKGKYYCYLYQDNLCEVQFTICDPRDLALWVGIDKAIDNQGNNIKLTKEQKVELFKRISADWEGTEVFDVGFPFITCKKEQIDENKSILKY